ncbi:hypothetical protein HDV06_001415 [Boothiomyces sp. JEL0866]|nr:hypothetical protein HDV06_001415 [Boothiomyces sp. JEL0866]
MLVWGLLAVVASQTIKVLPDGEWMKSFSGVFTRGFTQVDICSYYKNETCGYSCFGGQLQLTATIDHSQANPYSVHVAPLTHQNETAREAKSLSGTPFVCDCTQVGYTFAAKQPLSQLEANDHGVISLDGQYIYMTALYSDACMIFMQPGIVTFTTSTTSTAAPRATISGLPWATVESDVPPPKFNENSTFSTDADFARVASGTYYQYSVVGCPDSSRSYQWAYCLAGKLNLTAFLPSDADSRYSFTITPEPFSPGAFADGKAFQCPQFYKFVSLQLGNHFGNNIIDVEDSTIKIVASKATASQPECAIYLARSPPVFVTTTTTVEPTTTKLATSTSLSGVSTTTTVPGTTTTAQETSSTSHLSTTASSSGVPTTPSSPTIYSVAHSTLSDSQHTTTLNQFSSLVLVSSVSSEPTSTKAISISHGLQTTTAANHSSEIAKVTTTCEVTTKAPSSREYGNSGDSPRPTYGHDQDTAPTYGKPILSNAESYSIAAFGASILFHMLV